MGMFTKPLKYLAEKIIAGGASIQFEVEDLINVGMAAIWRARDTFNPALSGFHTYGMIRARGAMLDEMRALDHVPRLERARAKKDGRTLRKVESIEHDFTIILREDPRSQDPHKAAAAKDVWRRVSRIVGARAGEVVRRYYVQGQTLLEIAKALDLSESRICQLHEKAIRRLQLFGKDLIA